MRLNVAGASMMIRQYVRARFARALWAAAVLVAAAAALLLMLDLSSMNDSTRAATALADLRTSAQRVALAADLSAHGDSPIKLDESIRNAERRTAELPDYLDGALDGAEAEQMLDEIEVAWAETAASAYAFLAGEAAFETVVAAADGTGAEVDELLGVLAERSEARTTRLRTLVQGATVLLVLGGIAFAAAALRQRRRAAEVDALTGVLARDRFRAELSIALINMRRTSSLAVAIIDVDRFRRINETLGAGQGDRVLRDVARRIQDALPRGASVGRRGGDEFLVLLPDTDVDGSREIAQGILESLDQPLVYQTGELRAGVSIGLAVAPRDGREVQTLIQAADGARDAAKTDGGGTYRFAGQPPRSTGGRCARAGDRAAPCARER